MKMAKTQNLAAGKINPASDATAQNAIAPAKSKSVNMDTKKYLAPPSLTPPSCPGRCSNRAAKIDNGLEPAIPKRRGRNQGPPILGRCLNSRFGASYARLGQPKR